MKASLVMMNGFSFHMGSEIVDDCRAPVIRTAPNMRSQATRRREIRRRSNLPKAVQRRLGFKCK